MKKLSIVFLLSACAWGQSPNPPTSGYATLNTFLSAVETYQVGTADPPASTCTAGKDGAISTTSKLYHCVATNTWTLVVTGAAIGTGANNLVQLNSSSQLPAVSGTNLTNLPTPVNFSGNLAGDVTGAQASTVVGAIQGVPFTNTAGNLSTAAGITAAYFSATPDGIHAGEMVLPGNTTAPSIPANSAGIIGPNSASFTSWVFQLSATAPTVNQFLTAGTPVAGVIPLLPRAIAAGDLPGTLSSGTAITNASLTTPALGTPSAIVLTNATGLPASQVPATPLATPGTSITLTAPRGYAVCTGNCTVAIPTPAAGNEFCIRGGMNVTATVTLNALGAGNYYENTAGTAYGAANGTMTATSAVGNKICIVGLDANHYLTFSFNGTWTAN